MSETKFDTKVLEKIFRKIHPSRWMAETALLDLLQVLDSTNANAFQVAALLWQLYTPSLLDRKADGLGLYCWVSVWKSNFFCVIWLGLRGGVFRVWLVWFSVCWGVLWVFFVVVFSFFSLAVY